MCNNLQAAFEAARYRVLLGREPHVLHVDAPCPRALAQWISGPGAARCAWLITAYNPGAQPLADARNRARHALLRAWARAHARAHLDAVNEDPDRQWPDEPGVLIAGIEEGTVRAAARRFGQAAILAVPVAAPVQLVWTKVRRPGATNA